MECENLHFWVFPVIHGCLLKRPQCEKSKKTLSLVYSRLILCKTYRLDEDCKVLTLEELLYRCVQMINQSHQNAQMDVRLRSLVCLGLKEQALHLWLEVSVSFAFFVDFTTPW
jgi:hypothetical protein